MQEGPCGAIARGTLLQKGPHCKRTPWGFARGVPTTRGTLQDIARGYPLREGSHGTLQERTHCKRDPTVRHQEDMAYAGWTCHVVPAGCPSPAVPAPLRCPLWPRVASLGVTRARHCGAMWGVTPWQKAAAAFLGLKGNSRALPGLPHFLLHPHRTPR